jgi:hypothetical protein
MTEALLLLRLQKGGSRVPNFFLAISDRFRLR